jgi:hypothetical protein
MDITGITQFLQSIAGDQAVTAIITTAVILTLADFVLGVAGAVRLGTFTPDQVAKFIQTHVIGRVLPIATVAFLGHFEPTLLLLAGTASAAYVAETIGSIADSLQVPAPQAEDGAIADPTPAGEGNATT